MSPRIGGKYSQLLITESLDSSILRIDRPQSGFLFKYCGFPLPRARLMNNSSLGVIRPHEIPTVLSTISPFDSVETYDTRKPVHVHPQHGLHIKSIIGPRRTARTANLLKFVGNSLFKNHTKFEIFVLREKISITSGLSLPRFLKFVVALNSTSNPSSCTFQALHSSEAIKNATFSAAFSRANSPVCPEV